MQVGRRIAVGARRPALLFGAVFSGALIADQLTKTLVRTNMDPADSIPLVEGVFHFTFVRNTGAAFGLMPGRQSLFMLNSAIVLVAVAVYMLWQRPRSWWLLVALGLVSGGATGNLIDRLASGRVTDYLDFRGFPVFNIADACIFVGACMLVLWILVAPEQSKTVPAEAEDHLPEDHTEEVHESVGVDRSAQTDPHAPEDDSR